MRAAVVPEQPAIIPQGPGVWPPAVGKQKAGDDAARPNPSSEKRGDSAADEPRAATAKRYDSGSAPARLLIVEDDFILQQDLQRSLVEAGFEVVGSASSAAEAVRLAQETRPDLVIMDIRLQGQRDGVEAAQEIRETTGVRSIFASAHNDAATRARIGDAPFLGKPYQPEMIVKLVREVLRRANARPER